MSSHKRKSLKELPLADKIDLIKKVCEEKWKQIDAAKHFGVSNGTVTNILKQKDELITQYSNNACDLRRRKFRKTDLLELNNMVFEFFKTVRSKNVMIDGPILKEQALKFAETLNIENFSASNGWLEKWKQAYQISFKAVSGESASVDPKVAESWKGKISGLCFGYEAKDIWNADETGLFFKALPSKSLAEKRDPCKGGEIE